MSIRTSSVMTVAVRVCENSVTTTTTNATNITTTTNATTTTNTTCITLDANTMIIRIHPSACNNMKRWQKKKYIQQKVIDCALEASRAWNTYAWQESSLQKQYP